MITKTTNKIPYQHNNQIPKRTTLNKPNKRLSFGLKQMRAEDITCNKLGIKAIEIDNPELRTLVETAFLKIKNMFGNKVKLPDYIASGDPKGSSFSIDTLVSLDPAKVHQFATLNTSFFEHPEQTAATNLLQLGDEVKAAGTKILLKSSTFPRSIFKNPLDYWRRTEYKATLPERLKFAMNTDSLYSGYLFANLYPKEVLKETLQTDKIQELRKQMPSAPTLADIQEIPENRLYEYLEMVRKLYFDGDFPFVTPIRNEDTPLNVIVGNCHYQNNTILHNLTNFKFFSKLKEDNEEFKQNPEYQKEAAKLSYRATKSVSQFIGYALDNIMKGINLSDTAKQMLRRYNVSDLLPKE